MFRPNKQETKQLLNELAQRLDACVGDGPWLLALMNKGTCTLVRSTYPGAHVGQIQAIKDAAEVLEKQRPLEQCRTGETGELVQLPQWMQFVRGLSRALESCGLEYFVVAGGGQGLMCGASGNDVARAKANAEFLVKCVSRNVN